jgi:chromosomal replication initiation ATPase DnaA
VLWEQVLADLRMSNTKAVFDRNLRGSRLHKLQRQEEGEAQLVVEATAPWIADWLENRMKPAIRRAVEGRLGQRAEFTFLPVLDRQS